MTLDFSDENGPMHFEFVFQGFILGGSMIPGAKNLQVLRRELSILEKLESISHEKPCGKKLPTDEPDRALTGNHPDYPPAKVEIEITDQEHDMLYNYMSIVPWNPGQPLRNALKTIDWLQNVKSTERSTH